METNYRCSFKPKAMRTDEWSGEVNKLNEAPILDKEIHLSFSEVEIDLTGYENAILELVIEAGEVKA